MTKIDAPNVGGHGTPTARLAPTRHANAGGAGRHGRGAKEGNGLQCIVCIEYIYIYCIYIYIYLMYMHTEMYVAAGDCCKCLILIFRRFEVQWWCFFGIKHLAMMKTLMISAILGIVLIVLPFSVINSETQWRFPISSHSKMTNLMVFWSRFPFRCFARTWFPRISGWVSEKLLMMLFFWMFG